MNQAEARKEAIKRWGVLAFAMTSRYDSSKMVGKRIVINTGKKDEVVNDYYGQGKTWEEAFERATSKGH